MSLIHQMGCRALEYDHVGGTLLVSVNNPQQSPFFPRGSSGVIKLSTMNYASQQYVQLHKLAIRDMRFSPDGGQNVLLSVSMDKTVSIASLATNTVVQSYPLDAPAWTCCWNPDKPVEFACGLQNGW